MNIVESLNAKGATPETILQIMTNTVFEVSGDLSNAEMQAELTRVLGENDFAKAKETLSSNPSVIDEAALLWLSWLSEEQEKAPILTGAIDDADREMPFLELTALTLVALYGLYILGPNKITSSKLTIKQKPDGSYEETKTDEFADFSLPIKGLLGLFGGKWATDNAPKPPKR